MLRGELESVSASTAHAELLLDQAARHLRSARTLRGDDDVLAFCAAYDAARKALTSVLATQGLRPTSRGGHRAVFDTVRAQLDPPLGTTITPFEWMRRTRNSGEHPTPEAPAITAADVDEATGYAAAILDMARRVIPELPPYRV